MKARTAREKEVVALSAQLPPLSPENGEEARHCWGNLYIGKKKGWCSVCGHEMDSDGLWDNKRKKFAVCPHCGARLEIKRSPTKSVSNDVYYYSLVRTSGAWQVIRNFICYRDCHRRQLWAGVEFEPASSRFRMEEVSQVWIDGNGLPLFIGRSCFTSGYYYDSWNFSSPMTLKKEHQKYYPGGFVGKGTRLIREVKRNGLVKLRNDMNVFTQITGVLTSPEAETFAKAGEWNFFKVACDSYMRHKLHTYWPSIKVAMRHKYDFSRIEVHDYLDHIEMLESLGHDIRNPFYICPADFKTAHRRLVEEKERRMEEYARAREEAAERRRIDEAMATLSRSGKIDEAYRKKLGGLLAVVIKSGDITLQPLQNVRDFYEEGKTLHHCVFAMKYYEHKNCLILGAKVAGERTETVEVNTDNWTIVQCRGKYNQDSRYHQQIYQLATDNLQMLRRCM